MYRISLPFPYLQKKLYCSFAVISLRISWDLYTFAMLLLVVDLVHAVGRRRVAVEQAFGRIDVGGQQDELAVYPAGVMRCPV